MNLHHAGGRKRQLRLIMGMKRQGLSTAFDHAMNGEG